MTEAVYGVLNVFGTLQRAGAAAARLDDWTARAEGPSVD
jgi:hypothetical protein